jgi:beta-phosphoglucomutase
MPVSACIFDLDGVIVDTAWFHFLAWRRLANELGFDFDEAANESLKGVGRMESLDIILGWGGVELTPGEKQAWADRKNGWYREYVAGMTPADILDGALEFLQNVRAHGKKVGLGSSSKNARTILQYIGLSDFFDAVVDGTNITRSKPDPQVFLLGAEAMGLDPAHCIVFEDAQSGIDAALSGGFYAVGVGHPESLGDAHLVVPNFIGWDYPRLENALIGNH